MKAIDALLLTALMAVALAWPLHAPPISLHGEAREALVVRGLDESGNWVLPRRLGEVPSKPPLFHWIAAGATHLLGERAVAFRMPSALAAWATALAVLALGSATAGRAAGWLGVGALLGMVQFLESASEARVDMVFTACVTLALVAFFFWYRDGGRGARALVWLATAGAVLAKGPAGAVLVGLVIVVFLLAQREPRRLGALWAWPPALAAAVLVVGWYVLAWWDGGHDFVRLQLLVENLDRAIGRRQFRHSRGREPFSLVVSLALSLLPWSLVLPWAAVRRWRGEREDAAGRLLHAWWATVLAVFTLAAGKRNVYLLPLYPAVALLVGRALAAAATGPRPFGIVPVPEPIARRWPRRPALALVAIVVIGFDAVVLTATQAARQIRQGPKSLAPFAREVARLVPPDEPLWAAPSLATSDRWPLAFMLGRDLRRRRPTCPGPGAYLASGESRRRLAARGLEVVARSRRPSGRTVTLVRCRAALTTSRR